MWSVGKVGSQPCCVSGKYLYSGISACKYCSARYLGARTESREDIVTLGF